MGISHDLRSSFCGVTSKGYVQPLDTSCVEIGTIAFDNEASASIIHDTDIYWRHYEI